MAKQGRPILSISVNGTNFVGSAGEFKDLSKEWNQTAIHEFLAYQKTIWKMVTVVRNCLKACQRNLYLNSWRGKESFLVERLQQESVWIFPFLRQS